MADLINLGGRGPLIDATFPEALFDYHGPTIGSPGNPNNTTSNELRIGAGVLPEVNVGEGDTIEFAQQIRILNPDLLNMRTWFQIVAGGNPLCTSTITLAGVLQSRWSINDGTSVIASAFNLTTPAGVIPRDREGLVWLRWQFDLVDGFVRMRTGVSVRDVAGYPDEALWDQVLSETSTTLTNAHWATTRLDCTRNNSGDNLQAEWRSHRVTLNGQIRSGLTGEDIAKHDPASDTLTPSVGPDIDIARSVAAPLARLISVPAFKTVVQNTDPTSGSLIESTPDVESFHVNAGDSFTQLYAFYPSESSNATDSDTLTARCGGVRMQSRGETDDRALRWRLDWDNGNQNFGRQNQGPPANELVVQAVTFDAGGAGQFASTALADTTGITSDFSDLAALVAGFTIRADVTFDPSPVNNGRICVLWGGIATERVFSLHYNTSGFVRFNVRTDVQQHQLDTTFDPAAGAGGRFEIEARYDAGAGLMTLKIGDDDLTLPITGALSIGTMTQPLTVFNRSDINTGGAGAGNTFEGSMEFMTLHTLSEVLLAGVNVPASGLLDGPVTPGTQWADAAGTTWTVFDNMEVDGASGKLSAFYSDDNRVDLIDTPANGSEMTAADQDTMQSLLSVTDGFVAMVWQVGPGRSITRAEFDDLAEQLRRTQTSVEDLYGWQGYWHAGQLARRVGCPIAEGHNLLVELFYDPDATTRRYGSGVYGSGSYGGLFVDDQFTTDVQANTTAISSDFSDLVTLAAGFSVLGAVTLPDVFGTIGRIFNIFGQAAADQVFSLHQTAGGNVTFSVFTDDGAHVLNSVETYSGPQAVVAIYDPTVPEIRLFVGSEVLSLPVTGALRVTSADSLTAFNRSTLAVNNALIGSIRNMQLRDSAGVLLADLNVPSAGLPDGPVTPGTQWTDIPGTTWTAQDNIEVTSSAVPAEGAHWVDITERCSGLNVERGAHEPIVDIPTDTIAVDVRDLDGTFMLWGGEDSLNSPTISTPFRIQIQEPDGTLLPHTFCRVETIGETQTDPNRQIHLTGIGTHSELVTSLLNVDRPRETVAERIDFVLAEIAWPNGADPYPPEFDTIDLEADPFLAGEFRKDSDATGWRIAQQAANSASFTIISGHDGALRFLPMIGTQGTPKFVFGDERSSDVDAVYSSVDYSADLSHVLNVVQLINFAVEPESVEASEPTSIARFGRRANARGFPLSIANREEFDAQAVADAYLAQSAFDVNRVAWFRFHTLVDSRWWNVLQGLELFDHVLIDRRNPSTVVFDSFVIGSTLQVGENFAEGIVYLSTNDPTL